jgi:16S rRNA pseudouridine516 synthase
MLNKPADYVSATYDPNYLTVIDLLPDYKKMNIFPVGRLDIDTEGLLIISNDGK